MDMLAGFKLPLHVHSEDKSPLRAAFDRIQDLLSSKPKKLGSTLFIVDDISTLDWIGIPLADVQNFIRALRALCLKVTPGLITYFVLFQCTSFQNKETLVIRHHLVSPSREHDDLFRLLLQICTHHLEVRPLSSGRSGTVTGEVSWFSILNFLMTTDSLPRYHFIKVFPIYQRQSSSSIEVQHFSTDLPILGQSSLPKE